jgi:exoribonuclease R
MSTVTGFIKVNKDYTEAEITLDETQFPDGSSIKKISGFDRIGKVLTGDNVIFNVTEEMVQGVNKRTRKLIVGCLKLHSHNHFPPNKNKIPRYQCVPIDSCYPTFLVASSLSKSSNPDQWVVIEYLDWVSNTNYPYGCIVHVLGAVGNIDAECQARMYYRGVNFTKMKRIQTQIIEDSYSEYNDLTELNVVSVDPPGCKDIDDAFSYVNIDKDKIKIGVHITDVNYHLDKYGISLDKLQKRPTSVYLPNKVNHMLPDRLATDLASLIPNKKRPVISVWFTYDIESKTIIKSEMSQDLIVNKRVYSYDEYDIILGQEDSQLSKLFMTKDSHKLIERLMVMTNNYIAEKFASNSMMVFRTHKIESGNNYDKEDEPLSDILSSQSAIYSRTESKHDTLGLDYYTHFTSPLRRLIDLYVHRIVKNPRDNFMDIDIMDINEFNKNTKKLDRDINWINLSHNITPGTETECYVIRIEQESVQLYFSDLPDKVIIDFYPIPKGMDEHFMITNMNDNTMIITNNESNKSIYFELYKQIKVKLYPHPKNQNFRDKLSIETENLVEFFK